MRIWGWGTRQNDVRGRGYHVVSDEKQLRDDAQDVEVYSKGQKKVPKLENLVEWRCAGTKSKDS